MENIVAENVVETPVVEIPEVVEEAVNQAIEPVQVPTITVPVEETKKIFGMEQRTLVDVGITVGLVGAGAALDRIIPWAFRKIKSGVQTVKDVINSKKNGVDLNQTQPEQQTATEIPVPQTDATPAPQENK